MGTGEGRDGARAALLAVAASNFMVQLAMMPITTILPTVAAHFGVDAATAAWVMNAYLLTLTGLVLTTGRLGDLYGHRRVFGLGIAVYSVAAVLAGLAPSFVPLLLARALQGVGGALMLGNALAILMAAVPAGERGRAIGVTTVAASLGALLGVVMGSFLVSLVSWRWVFLVVVPAGLIAGWGARRLPEMQRPTGRLPRPDIAGAVLLFGMLTVLSLSFTHLHGGVASFEAGWPYHTTMHILAAVLLAAFIVVEARAEAPMMPLGLFRHRRFTMAVLANGIVHMTMMGSMFLVPFLVEQGLGRPPAVTGLLLAPMQLASMGAAYAGGWLYDRTRSRLIAPLALTIVGLGLGLLGLLGAAASELALLLILIGTGCATSVFMIANNTAIMSALPASLGGLASGMLETSRQLGHTVAVALAAGVLGLVAEQTLAGGDQAAALRGFTLAILSFALVAFTGVACAALSGEERPATPRLVTPPPATVPAPADR